LAKAELSQIEETIKISGLHRSKSKSIRQAAKLIIEKHHGKMEPLLSLPIKDARKALIQFDGDGPKTADVVLLFSTNKPTIPVDTHEDRVAKRLGFAPANGNYELVRQNLQTLYDTRDYLSVHLLLIEHGRKYCKARHPLCNKCPIKLYCPLRESGTS
jgi:endonuclease-3